MMPPINFSKHVYRIILAAVLVVLGIGTVVYHLVEKFPWVDAYYFSVVTLTTVGYGDYTPHTTFGKLFTTVYIFTGVGILTTFITYTVRKRAHKIEKRHTRRQNRKQSRQ